MWLVVALMLAGAPDGREAARREGFVLTDEKIAAAFTAHHPEWREHQPQMLALSKKLRPAPGVGVFQYLELLYGIVVVMEASPKKLDEVLALPKKEK